MDVPEDAASRRRGTVTTVLYVIAAICGLVLIVGGALSADGGRIVWGVILFVVCVVGWFLMPGRRR